MGYAKRKKNNCKWGGGHFSALPRQFTTSNVLLNLSPIACKLFFDLQAQYNGFNNGDLSITWKLMHQRRWRSKATLDKATKELLSVEVIIRTRQGNRRQCHLYAMSLYDIDECKGKIDVKPTNSPPRYWLNYEPSQPIKKLQISSRIKDSQVLEIK